MRVRVYYADTDAGGVAYHASYLRWMEMARWELMEGLGLPVARLAQQGTIFAVVRIQVDYRLPAMLGDENPARDRRGNGPAGAFRRQPAGRAHGR